MFYRSQIVLAVFLLLVSGTGCKSADQEGSVQAEKQPVTVQAEQAPAKQVRPSVDIKGKVLETMDVGGYTYVEIDDDKGPAWVAIPQTKIEKGQDVSVTHGMEMRNFESKTLGRTFDSIIFTGGLGDKKAPAAQGSGAQADPHANVPNAPPISGGAAGGSFSEALQAEGAAGGPSTAGQGQATGGSKAAMVPSSEVKVEKAEGENAYTVGELFEKKLELNNKKVLVRGKVVKVSPMIMGKNWLHIQDGTGDAANKTHDLVVTTLAEAEKDSVVVVEGTLYADRDFGAGYKYNVIVEEAEIK